MPLRMSLALFIAIVVLIPSMPTGPCDEMSDAAPSPLAAGRANEDVHFVNVTIPLGINNTTGDTYAWGDYNNDGYEDLLAKGHILFENTGPPTWGFVDVTLASGLNNSGYSVWGDYDNDGWLDIFTAGDPVGYYDVLWHNEGDGTFTNASGATMDDGRPSLAAAWGDYDRDGFIDLYIMNWRDAANVRYADVLWHNDGDGTFTDVTQAAGIVDPGPYAGMGAMWGDFNNDGWLDIYAGNYLLDPNFLWMNNHNGTFTDVAKHLGAAGDPDQDDGVGPYYYGHTAGSAFGDYNNDGNMDIWVGNLAHKDPPRADICDDAQLLRNKGAPFFDFVDERPNTTIPMHKSGETKDAQYYDDDIFGGAWSDFDNDGDLDLYVPEVKGYHSWAHADMYRNNGNGTFTDVADAAGLRVWANIGGAWADYDLDGDQDLVTEGTYPYQGPRDMKLFKSDGSTNGNHWLRIKLNGTVSNRAAIGARVEVMQGTDFQMREVEGGTGGHAHQSDLPVEFGFGGDASPVDVTIKWPSGLIQAVKGVAVDQFVNITEAATGPRITSISVGKNPVIEDETFTLSATFTGSPAEFAWDMDNDGDNEYDGTSYKDQSFNFSRRGLYFPTLSVYNSDKSLGFRGSIVLRVDNVAPVPPPMADITIDQDTTFALNATGTWDTYGDNSTGLDFNWSIVGGSYENWTGFTRNATVDRTFDTIGQFHATVTARDDDGATGTEDFYINVSNVVPRVTIGLVPNANEDEVVDIVLTGNDTLSHLGNLSYKVRYGDGTPMTDWSNVSIYKHAYAANGTYTIEAWVRDLALAENSTKAVINISNMGPVVVASRDNISGTEDQAIFVSALVSDTASDVTGLVSMWDWGDGNSTDWVSVSDASAPIEGTYTYRIAGTFNASVMVRDKDGAVGSDDFNVTIENPAPMPEIMVYVAEPDEDVPVAFSGEATDTESDIAVLSYSWDFGDGSASEWSLEPDAEHGYNLSGQFKVVFWARDDEGALGSADVVVTVRNPIPTCAISPPSRTTFDEDEDVRLTSEHDDNPSDMEAGLGLVWTIDLEVASNEPSLEVSFDKEGMYAISFSVTDDEGASCKDAVELTIENPAPVLTGSTVDKKSLDVGDMLTATAKASDTESDIANLTYSWDWGDGTLAAMTADATHTYERGGNFELVLTVKDDEGERTEMKFQVRVFDGDEGGEDGGEGGTGTMGLVAAGAIIGIVVIVMALMALGVIPGLRKKDRRPAGEEGKATEMEKGKSRPKKKAVKKAAGEKEELGGEEKKTERKEEK